MLNWANQFNIFCLLDNHQYNFFYPAFECLLGVGTKKSIIAQAGSAFEQLKKFSNDNQDWLFGHFGYDLKNEIENLQSDHIDNIGFADMHFFIPEIVIKLSLHEVTVYTDDEVSILEKIQSQPESLPGPPVNSVKIKSRISRQQYINDILKIKKHISRGDCYEINYCQEFFAGNIDVSPLWLYQQLSLVSPNPFAALYKVNDKFCVCASPERYLKKQGSKLLSQPIKGTSKRDLQNSLIDEKNKKYFQTSQKEKSENVTVVDLVRNDLHKICKRGSVQVDELLGIYSFPQVHQMISTVSGIVEIDIHWTDIIKATFPMGSMTGAPKNKVMQLIEKYEHTKRGLFSGAIGYVTPGHDFDFNVVIRSVFYNETNKYLSYSAGSGITYYSNPEKEYEECLLKIAAFTNILQK
ncbi:MAG: anthranilate synthase component I family protein [Chitinophagaceae bacterium]|nr:anthranilate synthase component I family protein [Chitinophagaceae bacterium]